MVTPSSRDPWRVIWSIATSDLVVAILLIAIATVLLIMSWLPQRPVSSDPTAYSRWLAEVQSRFGLFTPILQSAGLFTLSSSSGFRILLALLGGSLLLRIVEGLAQLREELQEQDTGHLRFLDRVVSWPWSSTFPLLAQSGALLLIVGLLINRLWGWEVEGVIVQGGGQASWPGTNGWVALSETTLRVSHSSGLSVHVDERGPGVRTYASDDGGRELMLQHAAEAEPVSRLNLPLTADQYFAVPDAHLIVRLVPQHEGRPSSSDPVLVQVYRVPSGQLAAETLLEGDSEVVVDRVALHFASAPYARLTVVRNPALGLTCFALVLLISGLVGDMLHTARAVSIQTD